MTDVKFAPFDGWVEAVRFSVPGKPEPRGSKVPIVLYDKATRQPRVDKHGRVMLFAKDDNPRSDKHMQAVHRCGRRHWHGRELLAGPVAISVVFWIARPKNHYYTTKARNGQLRDDAPVWHAQKPDVDKLTRCLKDGLTSAVWVDDALVCDYLPPFGKGWTDPGNERTDVIIYVRADAQPTLDDF